MTPEVKGLNALVEEILEAPLAYALEHDEQWSIQGFGMLRLYLDNERSRRLHVWDPSSATVSTIHDHPWDFTSHVISGAMTNIRYEAVKPWDRGGELVRTQKIRCGVGGCALGTPGMARLVALAPEFYEEGESYSQRAAEMHESAPHPGTITVIEREFVLNDRDIAQVAWREGDWVSAEPREATVSEVMRFTELARKTWASRREAANEGSR